MNKPRKTITLKFAREQLLYDIGNVAYVEGDVMEVQDEHQRHQVIDITEDGNIDRVTRKLDLAFAEAVEMLYPYAKLPAEDIVYENTLRESTSYEVAITVPIDFSQTTTRLIGQQMHEYMVCRVLADWLSITDKPAAQNWADKAAEAAETIRGNLNARCGRIVRTLRPF